MTRTDSLILLTLAAIWGGSFLFMRVSAPEFGAFTLAALRTGLAGLVLLPFLLHAGKHSLGELRQNWRLIALLGIINTLIPFTLFAYASQYAAAGYLSILNATTPFMAAIVAFVWLGDKLNRLTSIGLLLGFVGVGVLALQKSAGELAIAPVIASLLATACYGVALNLTQQKLRHITPLTLSTGSLLTSGALLTPLAIWHYPAAHPGLTAWLSAILLAVVCTAFAFVLLFRLISSVGPTKTATVTYLIPLFGVAWGWLFLNESLSLHMLIGGVMILAGVWLATRVPSTKA